MWRGRGDTQMDRREKERESLSAMSLSHNVTLHNFTGSISHSTNTHLSTCPFLKRAHTHPHTHVRGPTVRAWQTGLNLRLQHPWLQTIWTLIRTFTDGNTLFMNHCCSDTLYGFIIFLAPTRFVALTASQSGVQWSQQALLIPTLYEMEKCVFVFPV